MKVLLTGAHGFLGWHSRVALRALTDHDVVPVGRSNWNELHHLCKGADAVIHCAGVNRGEPAQVEHDNVALAEQLAHAIRSSGSTPQVVYANSIQAELDNAYGRGKAAAGVLLRKVTREVGGGYTDVRLPNLFGEHGAPHYNSFVATFIDEVVAGRAPQVQDRELRLLHAQGAARAMIDALGVPGSSTVEPSSRLTSVQYVLDRLISSHRCYAASGDIPPLVDAFDVQLFNSLRAAMFPSRYPIRLTTHTDHRGRLVETVRTHGGVGQTFVSTTEPGITRGEHFHLGKVERFVVLSGRARISLRRMFTAETVCFDVNGDEPAVVDMPTMWVHNITNVGNDTLTTLFWANELFDSKGSDTYPEPVYPVPAMRM